MSISEESITARGRVISQGQDKWGFWTNDGNIYSLKRSLTSESLFVDERVRAMDLELVGRLDADKVFDAIQIHSIHDGRVWDVFYWCDTCFIRSTAPGPCFCCRQPFELRESPID
ncbi:MAG: hypothetical protein HY646_03100 [Acidobacteria bacterium]|nr:hypothetical protein [Acidobacteriota bacterium]